MKKILFVIIILLCFTACTKDKEDSYTFELEGNPSTGFEWNCEVEDDLVDIDYTIKSTTNEKEITGAPVLYRYKLAGKKEGETILRCIYKRSWEEDTNPKKKEYTVVVDANLDVKIEEIV